MQELKIADLYVRVSTQEQAKSGYSIGEQESALKAYCTAFGYTIHNIHRDPGYSGATLERPGIQSVINDVKGHECNLVIVWKLDRLSRSQKHTLYLLEDVFIKNDCGFVSLNESFDTSTPIGRCMVGILSAFAQMERENIRMRCVMGKEAAAKKGRFIGSRAPFGYKLNTSGKGSKLVVDEYESAIVKELFEYYVGGHTLAQCMRQLKDKHGIACDLYDDVANQKVAIILTNPVYAGFVKNKDNYYEGEHEPIITKELFDQAAAKYKAGYNSHIRTWKNSSHALVAGLVYCSHCGARLVARIWGNTKPKVKKWMCYSVAKTSDRMVKDPDCTNRGDYFTIEELDDVILREIEKLAMEPETAKNAMQEDSKNVESYAEAIKGKLSDVEKQINRLMDLYQSGTLELPEITERLSSLKQERAALQKKLGAQKSDKLSKDTAADIIKTIPDIINRGDYEELSALVHTLIRKITIYRGDITISWAFEAF